MKPERGVEGSVARAMGMDADKWLRHANPWSVRTRLAAVPLFPLAVWARVWIGWPGAVAALLLVGLWLWLNVRLFAPASDDRRWETRAILGEKLWLDRRHRAIPRHHLRWILRLNVGSAVAILPMAYGALAHEFWAAAFGACALVTGQLWALDRYAWLYADLTRGLDPEQRMQLPFDRAEDAG